MFPLGVDTSIGSPSWFWPEDVPAKQKLIDYTKFDPYAKIFSKGAHMPLMIFVGAGAQIRRSPEALQRRALDADERGWTRRRRQSTQKGKSKGKGKGEARAGQEQGKGK